LVYKKSVVSKSDIGTCEMAGCLYDQAELIGTSRHYFPTRSWQVLYWKWLPRRKISEQQI